VAAANEQIKTLKSFLVKKRTDSVGEMESLSQGSFVRSGTNLSRLQDSDAMLFDKSFATSPLGKSDVSLNISPLIKRKNSSSSSSSSNSDDSEIFKDLKAQHKQKQARIDFLDDVSLDSDLSQVNYANFKTRKQQEESTTQTMGCENCKKQAFIIGFEFNEKIVFEGATIDLGYAVKSYDSILEAAGSIQDAYEALCEKCRAQKVLIVLVKESLLKEKKQKEALTSIKNYEKLKHLVQIVGGEGEGPAEGRLSLMMD
jgi:hypothetical protein